jgi:hypothetical protein
MDWKELVWEFGVPPVQKMPTIYASLALSEEPHTRLVAVITLAKAGST